MWGQSDLYKFRYGKRCGEWPALYSGGEREVTAQKDREKARYPRLVNTSTRQLLPAAVRTWKQNG